MEENTLIAYGLIFRSRINDNHLNEYASLLRTGLDGLKEIASYRNEYRTDYHNQ
jgi:hypothetical protein